MQHFFEKKMRNISSEDDAQFLYSEYEDDHRDELKKILNDETVDFIMKIYLIVAFKTLEVFKAKEMK